MYQYVLGASFTLQLSIASYIVLRLKALVNKFQLSISYDDTKCQTVKILAEHVHIDCISQLNILNPSEDA